MSEATGPESRLRWTTEDEFSIDGTEYACRPVSGFFPSTGERLCLRKPRRAVERYAELIERLGPAAIVEVGTYEGGSTAMMAQLAVPRKLIAVDIREEASAGLAEFIAGHGLEGSVSAHWGVDQADRPRLDAILAAELGGAPLDLVVDDASHQLEPSRRTFEALFPRLRPGGTYVLEDWAWAHVPINFWPERAPLTILIFELLMACGHRPDAIAAIEIDHAWAVLRRGEAALDPDAFELAELIDEGGRALIAGIDPPAASEEPRGRRWLGGRRRRG